MAEKDCSIPLNTITNKVLYIGVHFIKIIHNFKPAPLILSSFPFFWGLGGGNPTLFKVLVDYRL